MKTIEVVAAIIQSDNHEILATKRGYGEFVNLWEFPGGKIESGETRREALLREIKEELLLDIAIGEHFITVEYDYPNFHLLMHCYLCTIIGGTIELTEHKDSRWLNHSNLNSVEWLPADITIIEKLNEYLLAMIV